ncbi:MAG: hypothetical protein M1457_05530 [bacterium]|nr:hypothetical protein [bacterium]
MDDYVKIAILDNEVEAQLLDSLLDEASIPHMMHSYHDAAYDGMFQLQMGWGCVIAPVQRRAEILDLLADLRARSETPDETDTTPEITP